MTYDPKAKRPAAEPPSDEPAPVDGLLGKGATAAPPAASTAATPPEPTRDPKDQATRPELVRHDQLQRDPKHHAAIVGAAAAIQELSKFFKLCDREMGCAEADGVHF